MERVLVIDDNAGVRTLIREMLEQAGFESRRRQTVKRAWTSTTRAQPPLW